MKKSIILALVLLIIGVVPSLSQSGLKSKLGSRRSSSETVAAPDNSQQGTSTSFDSNTSFYLSFDLGRAGMSIPAFTDLNLTPQDAYRIKSHDFMLQAGVEQLFAKSPIHGPFVFGIRSKVSLAYSYWPTQQGNGEPGNFFASNGSYQTAGTYLHSGDIINIGGLRWAIAPDLTAHYKIADMLEACASVGPSIYGYLMMTIKDPWTGYSTDISNTETVWHSKFLTNHLKSFSVTIDWSVHLALIPPNSGKRLFFEVGMGGNSFFYGLGLIKPIQMTIK